MHNAHDPAPSRNACAHRGAGDVRKKQPPSGTCTRTCTADAGCRTPDVGRHLYLDQAAELNIDVPVLQYVYGVAKVQDALPSDRPLTVEPQALSGLSATPI
jgi:hypothetical protein